MNQGILCAFLTLIFPVNCVCSTSSFIRSTICHTYRNTAMVHQRCNSCLLSTGGTTGITILHVRPVVSRFSEIGGIILSVIRDSVRSRTLLWPLPVIHYLSHRCGNAAGIAKFRTFLWTKIPVRFILIPTCLNQRSHNYRCFGSADSFAQSGPLCLHLLRRLSRVLGSM